jgi:NAD+ synthase
MNTTLIINPKQEKQKIVDFLKKTFEEQNINNAVIGLSGGIDSAASFFLLKEALPAENIHVAHLYYFKPDFAEVEKIVRQNGIPAENIHLFSIKSAVDEIVKLEQIEMDEKVRVGNIAARMRMIVLFDMAKKHNALVCGTENKTENLLGYFTRFGDQASDIEPLAHLYKTQVLQLAKYMGVPDVLIDQKPTAGLWHGQTDEGDFGFTYEEADQVLFLSLETKLSLKEIEKQGFTNAEKILAWQEKNLFKHQVPYSL